MQDAPDKGAGAGLWTHRTAASAGIYPGWVVLGAGFVAAMLAIGSTSYGFQLFVPSITEEFQVSRAGANNAFIALLVGIAAWSPVAGRLLQSWSARAVMLAGAAAFATGALVLAVSSTPWLSLLAVFGPIGFGMVSMGGLTANALASRWFERRRGRALGFSSVASSAGGFAMAPLMALLIAWLGWRGAIAATGLGVAAVICVLALFFLRDWPAAGEAERHGETLDKDAQASAAPADAGPSLTFGQLAAMPAFWLLALGVGLLLASDQALLTSKYSFLLDTGLTQVQAVSIISAMTFSAIAGKIVAGFLAERIDLRILFFVVAVFHAALLILFLIQPGYGALLAFASLFGAAIGGVYPVWATLTAATFGARSFAIAFGASAALMQVLAIAAVRYIGQTFDATGSYSQAFWTFLAAIVLGAILVALLPVKRRS